MAIFDTLKKLRGPWRDDEPGATRPTNDQLANILNAAAYAHKDEGWGVNLKLSGNHGVRYDGTLIAADILHHRDSNILYDVFRDAGGISEPIWDEVGPPPSPERSWVAPIPPNTDVPPVDPPTGDLAQLIVQSNRLIAKLTDTVAMLTERVEALESLCSSVDPPKSWRMEELANLIVQRVASEANQTRVMLSNVGNGVDAIKKRLFLRISEPGKDDQR